MGIVHRALPTNPVQFRGRARESDKPSTGGNGLHAAIFRTNLHRDSQAAIEQAWYDYCFPKHEGVAWELEKIENPAGISRGQRPARKP